MGRPNCTRCLAYSTAISYAPCVAPSISAQSATPASSTPRRHMAVWSPSGPTGSAARPSRSRRVTFRVWSHDGTTSASGDSMTNEPRPAPGGAGTARPPGGGVAGEHPGRGAVAPPLARLAHGSGPDAVDRVARPLLLE